MADARTVYALYWNTRHGDQGIELFATESEAWLSVGDYIDVSDMTTEEADAFWGLLDKGDAESLATFRNTFYERLSPTGHDVLVEALTVPAEVARG